MCYSVVLHAAVVIMRRMAQDLATTKYTVCLKAVLLMSCTSEINTKQYNMMAVPEFTCPFYCQWFQMVHLVKNETPPQEGNKVWFERCSIFGSVAFKRSLSSGSACCRSLGQVSYCHDCCLKTSPHRTHTLQVVHYHACQPSVQSILPLRQRAHMWWKAKREEKRTARVNKGCWRVWREERSREAGEAGRVTNGECRAQGQRVEEQGEKKFKKRWQEKCTETRDKQQRALIYNKTQR